MNKVPTWAYAGLEKQRGLPPGGRLLLEADDEGVGDAAAVHRHGLAAPPGHALAVSADPHGGQRDAAGEPRAGRGRGGALQQVNLVDFIMMTFI